MSETGAAGWWPQVRAGLVALHLIAITLSALPSPEGGLNRKNWADDTVQAEFKAWAERFGMEKGEFEESLWEFANAYNDGYRKLLTPVRPYEKLVGSEQSWKMFIAPHRFPTRLEIGAREKDGEWAVLYTESSPTDTWRRDVLRLERLRSAIFRWGWPDYGTAWGKGCVALAALAFADLPDVSEVRCRFWKAKSPSPAEAASGDLPEGKWISPRVVRRSRNGEPLIAEREATVEVVKGAAAPGAGAPAILPVPTP
ncbi:MAG: hypothetical protein Q8P18_00095 [Pseudomonadota bacterium]|nr:hypothetical protein [Pseudomonadota bacterium]